MSFLSSIRLIGLLAVAWTLAALGAGALGVRRDPGTSQSYFVPRRSWHDTSVSYGPGRSTAGHSVLVDQRSGRVEAIRPRGEDLWELVSVSPWRDSQGALQAVGRWVHRSGEPESQPVYGLGLFRVQDGVVSRRVPLEILPTSRPCWVPGRPGEFLFTAGDGQLHRLALGSHSHDPADGSRQELAEADPLEAPPAVAWACPAPDGGRLYLTDPVMSCDARLRRLVIVSLRQTTRRSDTVVFGPGKLWWLELNEGADAIQAAGRVFPAQVGHRDEAVAERYPSMAILPGGVVRLVYLAVRLGTGETVLRCADLVLDDRTGRPAHSSQPPRELPDKDVTTTPIVVSADGNCVVCQDSSGRFVRCALPRDP
jgi:hypothetical protein